MIGGKFDFKGPEISRGKKALGEGRRMKTFIGSGRTFLGVEKGPRSLKFCRPAALWGPSLSPGGGIEPGAA